MGLIPIIGELADLLMVFLKYHFVFNDSNKNQAIGKYQKTALLRDYYRLYMKDANYKRQDWRVLAAVAVALDALQSR